MDEPESSWIGAVINGPRRMMDSAGPTTEAQQTDDLVETARRLAAAATPGPWVAHDCGDDTYTSQNDKGWWWVWQESKLPYYGGVLQIDGYGTGRPGDTDPVGAIGEAKITDNDDGEQERLDAEFIAWCRLGVPALVAELVGLRSELDTAKAEADDLRRTLLDETYRPEGGEIVMRELRKSKRERDAAVAELASAEAETVRVQQRCAAGEAQLDVARREASVAKERFRRLSEAFPAAFVAALLGETELQANTKSDLNLALGEQQQ